ncbi:ALF repeat-containing protein [Lentzea kentuckyensis]|uniref:ALF repeat-containing protein n=1 Tax=Lentzea kentuckyensis TaxID=360086 RepID=UPI000A3A96AF|nr:ALF repeat-containing protein [Lentzea kentuckyensis]
MRISATSAATLRRRSIAAVIITVLLALVGNTTPALAAPQPAPVLQQLQSAANEPVDEEYEFYKQLVQDIAEHAEDVEVRDAAKAALAVGTKEKLIWFLDHGEGEARAKAAERKRVEAAQNRAKVEGWARTGGPNVKAGAQAALNAGDQAIRDFVAYGYEIALKQDKQQAEDDKAEQDRIITRVRDMVEHGGPQVKLEGEALLIRGDYALIREFYLTGYAEANRRDHEFQAVIEQALIDRNKAITDLTALARRSEEAASARAEIMRANINSVKALDDGTMAMNMAAKAAHRADQILQEDKPGRANGQKGRNADLDALRAEATRYAESGNRASLSAAEATAQAQNAAVRLINTGLTNGLDWAKVTIAIGGAVEAAAKAAETAQHATEATLADSKALDANSGAQEHANNARKYREEAERQAVQAASLAEAAHKQQDIAIASRDKAAQQKAIAQRAAASARQHATNARNHRMTAQSAASNAVARAQAAVKAHSDAVEASAREQAAMDAATTTGRQLQTATSVCFGKVSFAEQVETALRTAREQAIKEGKDADEATRDIAAAAGRARTEANAAQAWAGRARAAAAAANSEAQKAASDARIARAAAARADQEAVTARRAADEANRLAVEATNVAIATQASADSTRLEAEATVSEANAAVWQSSIADRASSAAAASASMIIDPARMAEVIARPYAGINGDARRALETAAKALVLGEEQARSAREKAEEAGRAATAAQQAADRAIADVKPAYEAAARAAQSANQAAQYAVAANNAANEAAQHASGAHAAASSAAQSAASARSDAVGAGNAAAVASSAAQSAGQAAAAAEAIHQWAIKATAAIHAFENEVGTHLDQFLDAKQRAAEAERIARETEQRKKDELNKEFHDGLMGFMHCKSDLTSPKCKELAAKVGDAVGTALAALGDYAKDAALCYGGDEAACTRFKESTKKIANFAVEAAKGFAEGAANMWQGIVKLGECGIQAKLFMAPTACAEIWAGIKDLAQNPYKLIHLDVWHENPGKAFGLLTFDVLAAAATTPLGGSGSALSKALGVVGTAIANATAKLAGGLGRFGSFVVKLADNIHVPGGKLPGSTGDVLNLSVRIQNGIARLDGLIAVDGRLYKLKSMEMPAEGDLSRLEGSIARIEGKLDDNKVRLDPKVEFDANGVPALKDVSFKFEQMDRVPPPKMTDPPEGVVKDGVWTLQEYGQTLKLDKVPNKAVDDFLNKAKAAEGKITPEMEKLAREMSPKFPSARLEGLDYKLKSADSLKRKVVGMLGDEPDVNKALLEVNDAVRYTMVLDEAKYADGVLEGIKKLEAAGFEKIEVKNAWLKNLNENKYRGINTTWKFEDQLFEFQFHTEKSLQAKTIEHPWYELRRVPGTTQLEIDHAIAQGELIFADVPFPDRAIEIPVFKKNKP